MKVTYAIVIIVGATAYGLSGARGAVSAQDKTQWDGVYTVDQAKRGQAVYADACAACHGAQLTGGDMAPSLAGTEFSMNWNNVSVADLFDRIRTSMPQNSPGSLSRAQVADIVALILSKNNAPAGSTELPSENDQLAQIKLTAKK